MDYLSSKLKFPPDDIASFGDFEVEKYFDPRSKTSNEVVVFFRSQEIRDTVKAAGPQLATYGRSAGLRLHIPGHMMGNFKILENLGYQMRAVNPDVRRVVKFDDENLDLMMDVKFGGSWKRVRPADALKAKENNPTIVSAGPEVLTSSGISDFFSSAPSPATGANAVPPGQRSNTPPS